MVKAVKVEKVAKMVKVKKVVKMVKMVRVVKVVKGAGASAGADAVQMQGRCKSKSKTKSKSRSEQEPTKNIEKPPGWPNPRPAGPASLDVTKVTAFNKNHSPGTQHVPTSNESCGMSNVDPNNGKHIQNF
eukprot:5737415-Karenia_brevis.AAC.1